jgi:hypothetical protein
MIPLHLILSGSGIQMRRSLAPQRQQVRTAPTKVALPYRKVLLHASFEGTRIVWRREHECRLAFIKFDVL